MASPTPTSTPTPVAPTFVAFAEELARSAGALMARSPRPEVREKAPGDWCSELDAAIEAQLKRRIAEVFPEHVFWGEEGHEGEPDALQLAGRPTWLVDPIDGSMNFLRGYPQYAVSVALLQAGEPVAACILDPVRDECFTAAVGQGAWLQGRRLAVSETAALAQAVAATVFPKPRAAFMDRYLLEFGRVLQSTAGARRSGSMALELAYLAAGRVDVFWERGMGAWDAAAGLLLIREAGGAVWALDGQPWWRAQALAGSNAALQTAWAACLAHDSLA